MTRVNQMSARQTLVEILRRPAALEPALRAPLEHGGAMLVDMPAQGRNEAEAPAREWGE